MTSFPFYSEERTRTFERYAAEYKYHQSEPTPRSPLRRELRHSKAALVTTAGLRRKTQHSFCSGSGEFREIAADSPMEDLSFDFTRYDPAKRKRIGTSCSRWIA